MPNDVEKDSSDVLKLTEIPAISENSLSLLGLINKDYQDIDIKKLSNQIQNDPGLTAKIVGMANSAYFSPKEKIFAVENAIVNVLGLNLVKSIVLSVIFDKSLDTSRCENFSLNIFWQHSLSVALICNKVATFLDNGEISEDELYLCGLLHRIGLLALVHLFPEKMNQVFSEDSILIGDSELILAEYECIGFDHTGVGRALLLKWGLPISIQMVSHKYLSKDYQGAFNRQILIVSEMSQLVNSIMRSGPEPSANKTFEIIGVLPEKSDQLLEYSVDVIKNMQGLADLVSP